MSEAIVPPPSEAGAEVLVSKRELAAIQVELKRLREMMHHIHLMNETLATTNRILASTLINRIKKRLRPRLGTLRQHPPMPIVVPENYRKPIDIINPPVISIVTPSFNQGKFLECTIASVLDQGYPSLEYIIQDGGSQDDTLAVIKKHADSLKNWQSQPDNGQAHAINLGFKHASGDIMAYLNSDDLLLPGTLNYVANYFKNHPEVDVIYGHRVIINSRGQEIGRWIIPGHNSNVMRWVDFIPQETLFWRREIWEKAGGKIDESFQFALDWDLILRFQDAGANFVRLPRFLGCFRVHDEQKTFAMSNIGEEEMNRLRQRYHGNQASYLAIKKNTKFYLGKHVVLTNLHEAGLLKY